MFVYIRTNDSDFMLSETTTGGVVYHWLPIGWLWSHVSHPTQGYTALTYLFIVIFYMIIAVPGFIFWVWQMVEDDADRCVGASGTWLFKMWSEYPGLYGSWILYFLTVLMPILQLAQLNGDIFREGWINSIVQVSMMTLTWLATGIIHVLFVPALNQKWSDRCDGVQPKEAPKKQPKKPEPIETIDEPEPDEGNDWDL